MRFSGDKALACYPGYALSLFARGHRNEWGDAYREVYEDIQTHYGSLFLTRNANGRLSRLTKAATLEEARALAPSDAKRHPIVAISHYSNTEGDEAPTFFQLLVSDRGSELHLLLFLDLQESRNEQLSALLRKWLSSLPVFCGTASPAFAHAEQATSTITYPEMTRMRAACPGFQFVPHPPIGDYFDGLPNWGETTILGSDLTSRLGGTDAIARTLPAGVIAECVGSSLVLTAPQWTCGRSADPLTDADRAGFQSLADFLVPCRNSIYDDGYMPIEEWNRMTTSWHPQV